MKKIVLLFLLFFASSAFAIGFDLEKTVYEKQETIIISGICEQTITTRISAISDELEIFSSPIDCKEGSFVYEYPTSFLDHSGEWLITLTAKKEEISKEIFVKEKREGGFFLIRFLSPASGQYQRNQDLVFSVEVTDSGNFVTGAKVVTWGAKGEKLEFQNNGSGLYVLEYTVPLDAPRKEWKLEVLAQAEKTNGFFGGIGNLDLQIESAPIIIDVIEPNVSSFEQGDEISFDIKVTYLSGKPLENATVFIELENNVLNLDQITLENYKGILKVPTNIFGAVDLQVNVTDSALNESVKTIKLVIGCSITCLIKQYGLFVAAIVLVALAIGRLFYSRLSFKGKLDKLQKEKMKINELIKDLQKDYFTKGIMPSSSYKKNLSEYKTRLIEVEQEIMGLKKKEESE